MVVSERLGHATISITLDTFSHAIPAMQDEAAGKIAELVFVRNGCEGAPPSAGRGGRLESSAAPSARVAI